jgi:hypothetical protein
MSWQKIKSGTLFYELFQSLQAYKCLLRILFPLVSEMHESGKHLCICKREDICLHIMCLSHQICIHYRYDACFSGSFACSILGSGDACIISILKVKFINLGLLNTL